MLPHTHVCYDLRGRGHTEFSGQEYAYEPQHYAIYKPGQIHKETHLEETAVWCVGFYVHSASVPIVPGVYKDTTGEIQQHIQRIREEMSNHAPHYNIMLDLITSEMIIIYIRSQFPAQAKVDEIYYIVRLIDSNFNQPISTETMAQLSGYSYHHFRHKFRKLTGYSPTNYIIHKRIEHAKKLLTQTQGSITSIAHACGFCSSSQFSMLFKKWERVSPSQYRTTHHHQGISRQPKQEA